MIEKFTVTRVDGDGLPPFPLYRVDLRDGVYATEDAAQRRADREK